MIPAGSKAIKTYHKNNSSSSSWSSSSSSIGPKIKNAQDLLKFGILDISNIPISVLMPKIIFI